MMSKCQDHHTHSADARRYERSPRQSVRALALILVAAVGGSILLGGCGSGDDSSDTATSQSRVVTDPSKLPATTITFWVGSENEPEARADAERFERLYPQIKIKVVPKAYNDILTTAKLVLASDDPPDVMSVDQGVGGMGQVVKANLLRPLDRYAEAYGWRGRFSPTLLKVNSMPEDGASLGSGPLWGVSQFGEMIGVFYNREKFARLADSPPTSFAEFEALLEKAKAAGEIPLAFGNLDKYPGDSLFQSLANVFAEKHEAREIVFGAPNASFDQPAFERAASTMQRWAEEGMYPDGYASIDELGAQREFTAGKGVFRIDGTWATSALQKQMGDNVGFFLLPNEAGEAPPVTGGPSLPLTIPVANEHPDAAAAWIDFATGKENVAVSLTTQQIPSMPPSAEQIEGNDLTPMQEEIYAAWESTNEGDLITPYLNYATDTLNDTMTASIQELLAMRISPSDLVARLQDDLEKAAK